MSNKSLRTPSGGKIERDPLHSCSKKTSQLFINNGRRSRTANVPFSRQPSKNKHMLQSRYLGLLLSFNRSCPHTHTTFAKIGNAVFYALLPKCFGEGPFFLAARLFFHKLLVNIVKVESKQTFLPPSSTFRSFSFISEICVLPVRFSYSFQIFSII